MADLIVLPGLDGTATLRAAFVDSARTSFESISVLAYPADAFLDYAQLEKFARSNLPRDRPFILLGESFSGPVALAIAASPPRNMAGLVLSTTFARNPVPLRAALRMVARVAPVRMLPKRLLSWSLLGRWATAEMESSLDQALSSVSPDVLRRRAIATLNVDATSCLRAISMPALYLHATEDRLLSRSAKRDIGSIRGVTIKDVEGPHLLLQTAPHSCARAIAEFAVRFAEPPSLN